MDGYRKAELTTFANWVKQHSAVLLAVDPFSIMAADGAEIHYYRPTGGLGREDWPVLKDCFEFHDASTAEPYMEYVLINLLKGDFIRHGYDMALASTVVDEANGRAIDTDISLLSAVESTSLDNAILWLHERAEELVNDSVTKAPRKNRGPGRKDTTADIAQFAEQRHGRLTWKEIHHHWQQLYPDDTRVKSPETIREAHRRHHGDKAGRPY